MIQGISSDFQRQVAKWTTRRNIKGLADAVGLPGMVLWTLRVRIQKPSKPLSVQTFTFVLGLFSIYPLALVYRNLIWGQASFEVKHILDLKEFSSKLLKTKTLQNVYFALTGLSLCYFCFGQTISHLIVCTITQWALIKTLLGTKFLVPISFTFQTVYLLYGYYSTNGDYIVWVRFLPSPLFKCLFTQGHWCFVWENFHKPSWSLFLDYARLRTHPSTNRSRFWLSRWNKRNGETSTRAKRKSNQGETKRLGYLCFCLQFQWRFNRPSVSVLDTQPAGQRDAYSRKWSTKNWLGGDKNPYSWRIYAYFASSNVLRCMVLKWIHGDWWILQ